jgi:hypothetical protein
MMDTPRRPSGLTMMCQPRRQGRTLVFEYSLFNPGGHDVYVHDAMPTPDNEGRPAGANQAAISVVHGPDGDAIIGKFIPPMACNARPSPSLTPLAFHLAVGQTMERLLEVPEPLAETSPWSPDLYLRDYEAVTVAAVTFTIGYWAVGDEDGVGVIPARFARGLFSVVLPDDDASAGTMLISQRFTTRGLQLFRRKDDFARSLQR